MIKQIDENTRIELKFYLPALGIALCYQEKRWWGWRTISWTYPSIFSGVPYEELVRHLKWLSERRNEKQIGKIILSKCS